MNTQTLNGTGTPLVSVIIPAYNAESYVKDAMDSILSQTYTNLEVIVIDDGSTDNTVSIINEFKDERIRFVRNEGNRGIIFSLNYGLSLSRGKYIARLDSDDIALKDRIAKQVRFMENDNSFGICGTFFKTIDENGKILQNVRFPSNARDAKTYLLLHNCFCHSSVLMRAELVQKLRYAEAFVICEDYELWSRIANVSNIANLPEFQTLYRIHGTNISITKKHVMFRSMKMLNRNMLTSIGMPFTEDEMEVHSCLLTYQTDLFLDSDKIELLEKWILKLYQHFKEMPELNEKVMFRVIAKRWIVLCRQTNNTDRIFKNSFFHFHPTIYFQELFNKVFKNLKEY